MSVLSVQDIIYDLLIAPASSPPEKAEQDAAMNRLTSWESAIRADQSSKCTAEHRRIGTTEVCGACGSHQHTIFLRDEKYETVDVWASCRHAGCPLKSYDPSLQPCLPKVSNSESEPLTLIVP